MQTMGWIAAALVLAGLVCWARMDPSRRKFFVEQARQLRHLLPRYFS